MTKKFTAGQYILLQTYVHRFGNYEPAFLLF